MKSIGCDVDGAVFVEDLNLVCSLLGEGGDGVVHFVFRDLERLSSVFGGPRLDVEVTLDEPLQQLGFKLS